MAVYVFESVEVIGGGRGALIEMLRARWAVHLEEEFGIRLVDVWATAGSTANWPEANALWEMDDWAHFGRAQQARFPLEAKDPYGVELARHSLALRAGGHRLLLESTAFSPDRARIAAEERAGPVVLRENVRSRSAGLTRYHAALHETYLPPAAARGLRLLGAYRHVLRPNEGLTLWSFRDWEHVRAFMEARDDDAELAAWAAQEAALLDDIHGWLLARPPAGALRT